MNSMKINTSMKSPALRRFLITALLMLMSLSATAQIATVEYVEGWVDIKRPTGQTVEAFIGDTLNKDDTIITGDDGTATLAQQGASEIVVSPNSVFSIREIDSGGEKETVMHTSLGSVKFKFLRLFGREPKISTPSVVAGVRGTEFTVYAGDEGSALFTVDSGEVMVTSQGIPVVLLENEGVEVKAGRPPGQKFELKGRPIDYSSWNSEKQQEFSADPIAGLRGIEKQMDVYIREVENLNYAFQENRKNLETARFNLSETRKEKGTDAANIYYEANVSPLEQAESVIYLNRRYWSLSAFSLKRYIMAKQYSLVKANKLIQAEYLYIPEFDILYNRITEKFGKTILPILSVEDI
jgi:FecR protein